MPVQLAKKVSEEPASSFKRINNTIKKKGDKKKSKFPEIKPEVIERYKHYVDFLNLVNLTNNMKVEVSSHTSNYVMYVGKGNNSSLIKNLFRIYRPWWSV